MIELQVEDYKWWDNEEKDIEFYATHKAVHFNDINVNIRYFIGNDKEILDFLDSNWLIFKIGKGIWKVNIKKNRRYK